MPSRYNKNAQGKRVKRERISLSLGISKNNGLLDLFSEYLSRQGIEPTDEEIRKVASDWAYQFWEERLKREIEVNTETTIL